MIIMFPLNDKIIASVSAKDESMSIYQADTITKSLSRVMVTKMKKRKKETTWFVEWTAFLAHAGNKCS